MLTYWAQASQKNAGCWEGGVAPLNLPNFEFLKLLYFQLWWMALFYWILLMLFFVCCVSSGDSCHKCTWCLKSKEKLRISKRNANAFSLNAIVDVRRRKLVNENAFKKFKTA